MSILAKTVTVTATSVKLSQPDLDGVYGCSIALRNKGTVSIFIGGSNVTPATGFEVVAGDDFSLDLNAKDELYAITSSGSSDVAVIQVGI